MTPLLTPTHIAIEYLNCWFWSLFMIAFVHFRIIYSIALWNYWTRASGSWISPPQVPSIQSLGADSLRAALLAFNSRALHLHFDEQEVLKQRKFANKIWNSLRLAITNIRPGGAHLTEEALQQLQPKASSPFLCRWKYQVYRHMCCIGIYLYLGKPENEEQVFWLLQIDCKNRFCDGCVEILLQH